MIDYDLHIHTAYCGHAPAAMNVPAILTRADELGLKTIAITDHVFCEDDLAKMLVEIKSLDSKPTQAYDFEIVELRQ